MKPVVVLALGCAFSWSLSAQQPAKAGGRIGSERAVLRHLNEGEEYTWRPSELLDFGRRLFEANWTDQDGAGRPFTKGTGRPLSDNQRPLTGVRAFNRLSGPDANSCQGCHNLPYGITGGGGDFVTNSFEQAERFDFVTFDRADKRATSGSFDEQQRPMSLQTIGSARSTPGLFGAGYVEMLARQLTADLQAIRDSVRPGESKALRSTGISFGTIARRPDGRWDVSGVEGLPGQSLATNGSSGPSLIVRPWGQGGTAVSLREVTNSSYNQHLGIQSTERFGKGTDPDRDGVVDELTRGDVTAVTLFEAAMAVPGRVIPSDPTVEQAVLIGERSFESLHCTTCHMPTLALERDSWIYSEPNPFNPPANFRRGDARALSIDLRDASLPQPRLSPSSVRPNVIDVAIYADFKLHDLGAGQGERFLTRRLWGAANEPPFFHDGQLTTLRQAVLAHGGEARDSRADFERLSASGQNAVVEFLKSLQVLPPGTKSLVVDENYHPRAWPPPVR